ncbi:MAG: hypothetical protein ABIH85_05950 [Candidatus Omnitrophota bacterium]|nr:hypothetical protein [Candidatus Omnitrophota bacterium]MBU1895079.1 hypothetical protein [Candidatus Omnitrophota bacterium]
MEKRPTSITIIAWFLIVIGAISVWTALTFLNNPMVKELMIQQSQMPLSLQYAMMYVSLAVTILSGIGMLKRCGWARILYIVWGICSFLVGFATSPRKMAMIPSVVIFAIIAFFLYRPKATKYFSNLKD